MTVIQVVKTMLLNLMFFALVSCDSKDAKKHNHVGEKVVVDTIEVVGDCGVSEYAGEYWVYSYRDTDTVLVARERLASGGLGYTYWFEIDSLKDTLLFGKDFVEWQPVGDTLVYSSLQALTLDEVSGKYVEDDDFESGEIVYMVVTSRLVNGFKVLINDSLNKPVEYFYKRIE